MATQKTLLGFVHQQSFRAELAVGFTQAVSPPPATETVELRNVAEVEDPEIKRIVCTLRHIPDVGEDLDLSRTTGRALRHHDIEPLDAGVIPFLDGYNQAELALLEAELLADPPAVIHLSRRSPETLSHGHVTTNHLAVLCFFLRGDGRDDAAARRFAKFVCLQPLKVVPDLIHFAPGIFTPRHIGWILRSLMENCLEAGPLAAPAPAPRTYPAAPPHVPDLVKDKVRLAREAPHPAHRDRITQRQTLSEMGCRLIAAFLETKVSRESYQQRLGTTPQQLDANEPVLREVLGIPDAAIVQPTVAAHEQTWPVAKSIVATSDVLVIMSIIFAAERLREMPEPFGWFLGVLFGGVSQFAQTRKERREKHQRHVSAVLSLGFAAASFVPVAGQFAGMVGLLTDLAVRHHWDKEAADAQPCITRMQGLVMERLSTSLRDFEARMAIVEAMANTQNMGVKL